MSLNITKDDEMAKQVIKINKTDNNSLSKEDIKNIKLSHRLLFLKEMNELKKTCCINNINSLYLFNFLCVLYNFCSYKKMSVKDYIIFSKNQGFYFKVKEKLSNDKDFREDTIKAVKLCIEICNKKYRNLERLYYIDDFISDLLVLSGEHVKYINHLYNFYSPSIFLDESPIYNDAIRNEVESIKNNNSLSYIEKLVKIHEISINYIKENQKT